MTIRLAMWSGPRNISTAMMRSWENRDDTQVIDEPFYAYYLAASNAVHPMTDEILSSQPNNWQDVAQQLTTSACTREIYYQKQMSHHMLDEVDLTWCKALQHCFLIRDPRFIINSYVKKMPSVNSENIGIKRQFKLYQQLSELTGQDIPIIDSKDVLQNPEAILTKLCQRLNIAFDQNMLAWPKGKRASDGVWAKHWYENVEASSAFAPYSLAEIKLTKAQKQLAEENDVYYQQLFQKRITPI
ncbi:hypothetical protein ND16A_0818 [Thalassotalea sp. ND16A]|nr:hypothetical protein ND16A_0818 [Thalassotalea sp. ND16A]